MQPVKRPSFDVNRRFRRVQVLGLLTILHRPATERHDRAILPMNGDHQPITKSIDGSSFITLDEQAAPQQPAQRESLLQQARLESLSRRRGKSGTNLLNRLSREPAIFQLAPGGGPGRRRELLTEPRGRDFMRPEQRLPLPPRLLVVVLARVGRLGNGQPETAGELANRLRKCHFVEQFDELDDVSTDAASETVEETPFAVNLERRRLFAVKGTQAFPCRATSSKLHTTLLHNLHDVRMGLEVVDEAGGEKSHEKNC